MSFTLEIRIRADLRGHVYAYWRVHKGSSLVWVRMPVYVAERSLADGKMFKGVYRNCPVVQHEEGK